MAVLKRNRAESKIEYMRHGFILIRTLFYETMRDFGSKKRIRDYKLVKDNASPEELAILEELESKIGDLNKRINLQLPDDFMAEARERMYSNIFDFNAYLSDLYTYPTNKNEYEERLETCKEAIHILWKIKNLYTAIDDIDGGHLKMFCKIINMIDKEISLLKGVKEYTKKKIKEYEKG